MKVSASSWLDYLFRLTLTAVLLVALCRFGMMWTDSQNVRLVLLSAYAFAVACGVFLPRGRAQAVETPLAEATPTEETGDATAVPAAKAPQEKDEPSVADLPSSPGETAEAGVPGEAEFIQARNMYHQFVPDFEIDGIYLDILGESAEKGYAPAMEKLGDYAIRREAWVEAYYWMSCAKRHGMQNLESALSEIRLNWALGGYPEEEENVHALFDEERGSIGRALLCLASGHNAATAREYLRAYHPEFL